MDGDGTPSGAGFCFRLFLGLRLKLNREFAHPGLEQLDVRSGIIGNEEFVLGLPSNLLTGPAGVVG